MIPRYTQREFADLWSDASRYAVWLEVELAACQAMEDAGSIPRGTADGIRRMNLEIDVGRIEQIEETTRHDVIAFLTHIEELVGPSARWLHRGMTSSDVLDTSLAILLVRASDLLLRRLDRVSEALALRAREHVRTPIIGRSHGIHAEPVTFGIVLAGHLAEIKRGAARLRAAREAIAVGKIAGAVGTYAHLSPEIERAALAKLGLRPETVATQVVARDRHAELFATLALIASSVERFATNVRHWQRTEVGEVEERFHRGQKGSSAMPHKRNPVLSENLVGLARVVRSAVVPALENVTLWHERDISHSSVERMIAPDATTTLAFMLDRMASVVEGLVVYGERMRSNLEATGGLFFSEGVLLALVDKGVARQAAYEIVQRNAMKVFEESGDFHALLREDDDVSRLLSPDELDRCFDLDHALRCAEEIVERAVLS